MPNGRSGGFLIQKTDLVRLLEQMPTGEPLGRSVAPIRTRLSPIETRDIDIDTFAILVSEFNESRVWVEEQDYSVYVLHLDWGAHDLHDPIPGKWIIVTPGSPLFNALREQHDSQK